MLFEKCCLILTLCQRHGCWCYGSSRRQDININSTGYKKLDSCAWWAFCQIRKNAGCACTGTQVPWCMPGSLTNGFLWSWWRGKCSRYSGACATHNYTHLVRGPWKRLSSIRVILTWTYIYIYIYIYILWRFGNTVQLSHYVVYILATETYTENGRYYGEKDVHTNAIE